MVEGLRVLQREGKRRDDKLMNGKDGGYSVEDIPKMD